ncbi:MAG: hypothetical protein CV087_02120 [Candidatus Brocadia sp. WS118]|nr:MAG: hypothetical protein CV087_02120 [Candidatus Brocadia sp. WS118]
MCGKKIVTVFLLIVAGFLVLYSYGYYKKHTTVSLIDEKIKMGKYKDALASVQKMEESSIIRIVSKLEKDDPTIAYTKGVVYALMENKKKASAEFRKAMETNDPVLKARAIYNTANLIATDMDFSTAAMQYTEVLKIDPNDFQAKKNLERMRLGEQQFNTMFSPEQQEREDRIEALKLLPWGTKYKYSGEQKLRW